MEVLQASLPDLDVELGLQLAARVLDLQLDVLRAGFLGELQGRTALVVAVVRALAGEEGSERVFAGLEVADAILRYM